MTKRDDLLRHYDPYFAELGRPRHTSIGTYHPTDLRVVKILFDQLEREGFFEPFDVFLDAGGGDARVAALASLYSTTSYSVEGDVRIHEHAVKRVQNARAQGILPGESSLRLRNADFLDMRIYGRIVDHEFDEITIFFNGGDNEEGLARMLARSSGRKGQYLILMQSAGSRVDHLLKPMGSYYDNGRMIAKAYHNF